MDKNKTRVKANDGDDKVRRSRRPAKKRVCEYCQGHIDHVDYKDVERLKKYTAENGKILPRRATGLCAEHQRDVHDRYQARARNGVASFPRRIISRKQAS